MKIYGKIPIVKLAGFCLMPACLLAMVSLSRAFSQPGEEASEIRGERVVAVLFSVWQTKDARTEFDNVPNLDLLQINGKPMIMHVYNAIRASKYIDKIMVFAAPEVEKCLNLKEDPKAVFYVDKGDAAANVLCGIGEVTKGDLLMFIPSDLPLVTSESLDQLIERVRVEKGFDLIFPLVSKEACERKYPEEARTYGRFKEGAFTGAHVEFLRPDLFLDNQDEVKAQKENLYNLYSMRKSTFGAARFLGIKLAVKYIFGNLSYHELEEHVYEKYEVTAKAILWENPDLATDVSEPADIPMISHALQQRAAAHSSTPACHSSDRI